PWFALTVFQRALSSASVLEPPMSMPTSDLTGCGGTGAASGTEAILSCRTGAAAGSGAAFGRSDGGSDVATIGRTGSAAGLAGAGAAATDTLFGGSPPCGAPSC